MATTQLPVDVLIIGSGPAGLTAAIYAARAGLNTVLVEGNAADTAPGGQLMLTTEVENFPGHPDGIMGPMLIAHIRKQAVGFGVRVISHTVTGVEVDGEDKSVTLGSGEQVHARAIIVATGATALTLGLDAESRLLGRGVSTCATCDGYFYRGRDVVVVGGGDSALEEALLLTKLGARVTLVHRRNKLRASYIMQQRARQAEAIFFAWNRTVHEIRGDDKVSGVVLREVTTGRLEARDCAAVFVAIGHAPSTELFRGKLILDASGYIVAGPGTQTSAPGVFACGDVVDHTYRQAVTAAGTGCMAALDVSKFLEEMPGATHAAQ